MSDPVRHLRADDGHGNIHEPDEDGYLDHINANCNVYDAIVHNYCDRHIDD